MTGYIDSPCLSQKGRTVEIYLDGAIDFTGWSLVRQVHGEESVGDTETAWEHLDTYYYRNDRNPANGGTLDPAFAFSSFVPFGTYQHDFLSAEQTDIEGFNLYPNPVTTGKVTITTARNLTKAIVIFDVLGKQVLNRSLPGTLLDVSSLNAGIYIIKITENNKTITRKLVVK